MRIGREVFLAYLQLAGYFIKAYFYKLLVFLVSATSGAIVIYKIKKHFVVYVFFNNAIPCFIPFLIGAVVTKTYGIIVVSHFGFINSFYTK